MRNRSVLLSAALAVSLFGCNNALKTPDQKAEANKHWNAARASVLASLANEQFRSGNFEKCRRTIDDALKLVPESEPLHVLAAKLDIENGQLELAEQELKLARHYSPNDPEPYYLSGVVYQRWQKPDVAYDFYHQASTKAPAELAYLLAQGEMLVTMDRSPEALQLLAAKVTYFEHSGAIRDAVGQLLAQGGRYHEAAAMFREASILSEDDAGIRERLALAQYHDKNYREASEILVRLLQTDAFLKRTDLFVVLGECQLNLGKSREARYSFETASQLDQYDPHIWVCLGRASLEVADYHRAELSLKRALKLDAAASETHLLLGYTYLHQNNASEALNEFQKASSLDSRDTVSLCMIGYALQKLGQNEQASQYYARALHLKPGDEMARTLMADIDLSSSR